MSVVAYCQSMFHVDLPSVVVQRGLEKKSNVILIVS